MMRRKFRYEKPQLIEMSTMSAAGGATVCSSGSGQGSCAYGSCIRGAQCNAGDYPTYCYSGGFVTGTCAFCVTGGEAYGYDSLGCGTGGMAASYCTQGASAGYNCGSGSVITPCTCY
jgi:hypothetical protein